MATQHIFQPPPSPPSRSPSASLAPQELFIMSSYCSAAALVCASPGDSSSTELPSNQTQSSPSNALPPPSNLTLPQRSITSRRLKNAKNLSLNVPSLSQMSGLSLSTPTGGMHGLQTAPIRTLSKLDFAPPPTSIPPSFRNPSRNSSVSTHKQKKLCASLDLGFEPSHLPTSSKSKSLDSTASPQLSYYSTPQHSHSQPAQIHSRSLSIKIPDSPKKATTPSDAAFSFTKNEGSSEACPSFSQSSSITPSDRVVVVTNSATLPFTECMETAVNAYPDGPLAIDDTIFLYSEPTREQAEQFDVIINVAREVKNPFESSATISCDPESYRSRGYSTLSESLNSDFSSSLPSSPPSSVDSSSDIIIMPPAGPVSKPPQAWPPISSAPISPALKRPEYISVPWEHTSKLTGDLEWLTALMAERAAEGKRILVHCQCGVSRSASLIVAYAMRQNLWGMHQAYSWVKEKSPAISPNMTLIYQLMEWGTILNIPSAFNEEDEDADISGLEQSTDTIKPGLAFPRPIG